MGNPFKHKQPTTVDDNDVNGLSLAEHILSPNPHPNASMGGSGSSGDIAQAIAEHNSDPSPHTGALAPFIHSHSEYVTNQEFDPVKNMVNTLRSTVEGMTGTQLTPGNSNPVGFDSNEYITIDTTALDDPANVEIREKGFNALDIGKWGIFTALSNAPESNCEAIFVDVDEYTNESDPDGLGFYIVQKAICYPSQKMYIRVGKTTSAEDVTEEVNESNEVIDRYPNNYTFGPWTAVGTGTGGAGAVIDYTKERKRTYEKYWSTNASEYEYTHTYVVTNTGFVHVVGSTQHTLGIKIGSGDELPLSSGGSGQGTTVGTLVFYAEAGTEIVISSYYGIWGSPTVGAGGSFRYQPFQQYTFIGIYEYGGGIVSSGGEGGSGSSIQDVRPVKKHVGLTALVASATDTPTNLAFYDQMIMIQASMFNALSTDSAYTLPSATSNNVPLGTNVKYVFIGGSSSATVTIQCPDGNKNIVIPANTNVIAELLVINDGSKKWALIRQ